MEVACPRPSKLLCLLSSTVNRIHPLRKSSPDTRRSTNFGLWKNESRANLTSRRCTGPESPPLPAEELERRKKFDPRDNPLTQWFSNFSEADELLKLAAARQQCLFVLP
ncbi:transcription initiation factor TFIID subunit 14b-like protein [Tanacetum coccineum]